MRKLIVFNNVSLDGSFVDDNGDMRWAHQGADDEWNAFVSGNASGDGVLVFGRVTYDLMASYWPTPMAAKNDPVVANRMNAAQKIVFSRTMKEAAWQNTTLIKTDAAKAVAKLKSEPGNDMVVLGSGSLVAALAEKDLIDEYQIVVVPVAIGGGRSLFKGLTKPKRFKLVESRAFKIGNVVLRYVPA
jgi:dihydrofolate reductase